MLKLKSKKIVTLCCTIALVLTCSISAFAGSDGWTDEKLYEWRQPRGLARANYDGEKTWADVKITKLDGAAPLRLYVNITKSGTSTFVADEKTGGQGSTIKMNYVKGDVKKNDELELSGGNYYPNGAVTTTSGKCNFH